MSVLRHLRNSVYGLQEVGDELQRLGPGDQLPATGREESGGVGREGKGSPQAPRRGQWASTQAPGRSKRQLICTEDFTSLRLLCFKK